jgi:glycosyltransferase involved in cell wall biosynthesis
MIRISIIIPAFNGEKYVAEAVEAARRQTRPPDEIVVVDDGSQDDTARVARAAGARVMQQENRGVCSARNTGLAHTSGDLVVFTDHDDRLKPEALEIGLAALEAHPQCGFVYGYCSVIDERGQPVRQEPRADVVDASYERMLAGHTLVPPGCAVFRRGIVEAVGGFREGGFLAEDYDLYLRVLRLAPAHCHNREVVEYRSHGGNASRYSYRQLGGVNAALDHQQALVAGDARLERAIAEGRAHWGRVFAPGMAFEAMEALRNGDLSAGARILAKTLRADPASVARMLRHFVIRALAGTRG